AALAPLHRHAKIERLIVSTYQAVSGAGKAGLDTLEREMRAQNGLRDKDSCFAYPIACNLIPQIGRFNDEGYTSEEMKMQFEGRKILHDDQLRVACTCVRVPIARSHSEAITVEFKHELTPEKARELIENAPGLKLVDDPDALIYPMPISTSNQDLVFVGRIRRDLSAAGDTFRRSLTLFCCADQIRKGAATNAVQIAELLLKPDL
ncbi:aspartate-semialdehyde dehydrogenase, partial [gut metagenome]